MPEPVVAGGMQNGFDARKQDQLSERERALVAKRTKVLGPAYKLMYEHPIEFVRAEGVHMYDRDGNAYLDCYNNVVSVGHCNPRVNAAVIQQMGCLNTHTRYLSEHILNYSEELLETFEAPLDNVMFTCTGSEAVDLALRIAKFYTQGTGIIVTDYAYHGITAQVAAISTSMGPFVPLDRDVRMVRAPYAYRAEGEDVGERLARDIEAAVIDMQRHGIKFAGFIADSLFSTDGLLPVDEQYPNGFLKPAIDMVHKYNGLYIADEVQPGFGRTGATMWGYQQHHIVPDLVAMGKPMGNGIPIAAVVAQHHFIEDFGNKARYFNTFGGNPVSIAAAHAVLREVKGGARENGRQIGKYILDGFRKLKEKYTAIGDVRGAGMYFAVEFVKDRTTKEPDADLTKRVVSNLRERRVLMSTTGQFSNSLKIRPLLIFSKENADTLVNQLDEVLAELAGPRRLSRADTTVDVDMQSSLEAKPGVVDVEFAQEVLEKYYGLKGQIKKLRGERDQNFHVQCTETREGTHGFGEFVLKFLHPSEDLEFSNFQTSLTTHIESKAPQVPIQKLVHPVQGAAPGTDLRIKCPSGEVRTIRMTTFIAGELMSTSKNSLEQKENLGRLAGTVTGVLQDFHHIGQNHVLLWDIQHASDLRKYLPELQIDDKKRKLLEYCIDAFEQRAKPKYPGLRFGVVHNDYNGDNIVVGTADPAQIVGLLDFGDAVFTPVVNDVAVGAVYQLDVPGTSLVEGAVAFIRGYNEAFPLKDEEKDIIFDLMLTRMFVRLVLHTWRAAKFPENREYVLRNTEPAWKHLEIMVEHEQECRKMITQS